MMEKDEKLQMVPSLHMQGNALVRQQRFKEAASKYKEAVLLLKTVQSRVSDGGGGKDRIEGGIVCRLVWVSHDFRVFGTTPAAAHSRGKLLLSCFALLHCDPDYKW